MIAAVKFTPVSRNAKTGPIPVTTTDASSCPEACPLKRNGCYAEHGPLWIVWRAMHGATDWSQFTVEVAALPEGQLWRHNQAGDLPHTDQIIDAAALDGLVEANRGKRGFTYTHHDMAIAANRDAVARANANGFTINLSANNLEHADRLMSLRIGPVAVVLPAEVSGNRRIETPAGNRVVVCPATYRDGVSCSTCKLCAVADRNAIIGFPAHGGAKRKASQVAA